MNQDKINLYDAQMAMNLPSAAQITAFVYNGFAGIKLSITKNDIALPPYREQPVSQSWGV